MDNKLSKEEQEILKSYRNGEWEMVDKSHDKVEEYQKWAKESMTKDKRINIRITTRDYMEIRRLASREGIPYQTLVSSIIHKYINGFL